MSKKLFLAFILVFLLSSLISLPSFAAVPQKMNFQGRLLNIANPGSPTPEVGGRDVKFTIWTADPGGTQLWHSTNSVSCDSQGQFSTVFDLSMANQDSPYLDFSKPMWLDIEFPVGIGSHLVPRQPLETVPYAFYAATAETVVGSAPAGGWKDSSGITVELVTSTDRVGIGTASPAAKLHVAGNIIAESGISWFGGNVGIGTGTPGDYRLKVNGVFSGTCGYLGTHTGDGLFGTTAFPSMIETPGGNRVLFGYRDAGGGEYSPRVGFLQAGNATPAKASIGLETNGKLSIGAGPGNGTVMTIDQAGNVGIGTVNPRATFDVAGTTSLEGYLSLSGLPTGGGAFNQLTINVANGLVYVGNSSLRYKHDIKDFDYDQAKFIGLRPVRFKWNSTGLDGVGLIAEEVVRIYPELVSFNAAGQPDSVNYDGISIVLLKAVQEQQKQIEEQKLQMQQLQTQNNDLKSRIEALEKTPK